MSFSSDFDSFFCFLEGKSREPNELTCKYIERERPQGPKRTKYIGLGDEHGVVCARKENSLLCVEQDRTSSRDRQPFRIQQNHGVTWDFLCGIGLSPQMLRLTLPTVRYSPS